VKVLLASPIDPGAVAVLEQRYDVTRTHTPAAAELTKAISDRDTVVLRSGVTITAEMMDSADDLRLILRAGSGVDNIDVDHARRRRIRVVRIPGMSAPPVAELTFALLLATARKVALADRLVRQGRWPKPLLGGPLLTGKTLGVIGAGNIGGLVGQMGAAWGMKVLGSVALPDERVRESLRRRGITLADNERVLTESDFVCLHVPLDESTRHMIGADELARMKPGSILVNIARGGVVDEAALYDALASGTTLAGAALDVHEVEGEGVVPRLAQLDNVVLTPHIGAMALDSQRLIGDRVIQLLDAYQRGRLDVEVREDEHVV
jgi:phosphoglycerate dehydrogenase-like enzyme